MAYNKYHEHTVPQWEENRKRIETFLPFHNHGSNLKFSKVIIPNILVVVFMSSVFICDCSYMALYTVYKYICVCMLCYKHRSFCASSAVSCELCASFTKYSRFYFLSFPNNVRIISHVFQVFVIYIIIFSLLCLTLCVRLRKTKSIYKQSKWMPNVGEKNGGERRHFGRSASITGCSSNCSRNKWHVCWWWFGNNPSWNYFKYHQVHSHSFDLYDLICTCHIFYKATEAALCYRAIWPFLMHTPYIQTLRNTTLHTNFQHISFRLTFAMALKSGNI